MKFIQLDQRSDNWHQWRKEGITATESVVILNKSSYKTPWLLWNEKVGKALPPDLSKNPAVAHGVAFEPVARQLFQDKHKTVVIPACAESDFDSIFRASFDGLTPENIPVEFKCPHATTLEDVKAKGRESQAFKMYEIQVQHQIFVADAPKGWLVFYDDTEGKEDLIEFEIARNDEMIKAIVLEGRRFFQLVQNRKEPPRDPVRDLFIPPEGEDREQWVRCARDFQKNAEEMLKLQEKLENLKGVQDSLKAEFLRIMGENLYGDFAGVAVTRSLAKGRIDYRKYCESILNREPKEAELDQYRAPSTERLLVRITGSATPTDFVEDEAMLQSIEQVQHIESMWF